MGESVFLGGGDVDSYGDLIYINNSEHTGQGLLDVYRIGVSDPVMVNQHPDNPLATDPVIQRTLTHIKTYTIPKLSRPMCGELYAVDGGVYFLGESLSEDAGDVFYYDFNSGVTSVICDNNYDGDSLFIALLGYDDVNDVWYAGLSFDYNAVIGRIVYSFNKAKNIWEKEFEYEDMHGGHLADTYPDRKITHQLKG